MKRKGFTLIELLVVIAIIALLVSILMPSLSKARELAKRAGCGMNVSAIGKGLAMYTNSNNDQYPFLTSTGAWDTTATGSNRANTTVWDTTKAANVTALMFMLVRDGQSAKYFICPSENSTVECTDIKNTATTGSPYYWDFNPQTAAVNQVSYGYQVPLNGGTTATNGVSSQYPSTAILADKPPGSSNGGAVPSGAGVVPYASGATADNVKQLMSQNHTTGEYINFLRADYSVGNSKKPDCGYNSALAGNAEDNIYTASTYNLNATTGNGQQYGAWTVAIASHKNCADSYIAGPRQ